MYEINSDKLQPYLGEKNVQLIYIDTDSFAIKKNAKDIIKDLQNLKDFFDFNNLSENLELFSKRNKKVI